MVRLQTKLSTLPFLCSANLSTSLKELFSYSLFGTCNTRSKYFKEIKAIDPKFEDVMLLKPDWMGGGVTENVKCCSSKHQLSRLNIHTVVK